MLHRQPHNVRQKDAALGRTLAGHRFPPNPKLGDDAPWNVAGSQMICSSLAQYLYIDLSPS